MVQKRKAASLRHRVLLQLRMRRLQQPSRMMDVHAVWNASMAEVVQTVALRQEVFEGAFDWREHLAGWSVRAGELCSIDVSPAVIRERAAIRRHAHGRLVIRKVQQCSRGSNGERTSRVEAEEIHAWPVADS